MRWSVCGPPPGCSASAQGRSWRHVMPAPSGCWLCPAGWLDLRAWFYPALVCRSPLLARQVIALDIQDPARCLRLFRANREVGLAVGLAILAGWL